MKNGQHASASAEWWTPPEIVEPARLLFGGFDLDVASCSDANRIVQTRSFYSEHDDGLMIGDKRRERNAAVAWCNPPSKRGENAAWEWWVHGAREWQEGRVAVLFFVVFNPSTFFQTAAEHARRAGVPSPQKASRVEFFKRVRYLRASPVHGLPGFELTYERGEAPPHGSAILMLSADPVHASWFGNAYAALGDCVVPLRMPTRDA